MNAKVEAESSGFDTVKLILAVLVLIAGIVGFYYFEAQSQLYRVLGMLAMAGVSVAIIMQTVMGRGLWRFAADARTEVRKVVWPSRQETIQTTLIVFAMVLVMGVVLWLFDMVLGAVVNTLTGQG
ncbi:MAG: preprotein translocase subunit SecE [Candidatus Polarisedimenticolaceae bacterium]|nr:preprotein translocase subunit SecE [Candidatus Polarisedimenticolaceae bacterium]